MVNHTEAFAPKIEQKTLDKGHGRLEIRQYACFDVSGEYSESRWHSTCFRSLIRVKRTSITLKTNNSSEEVSYYLSNKISEKAEEYFQAVRIIRLLK